MGVSREFAEAICREHAYRRMMGDVFVVGRQTILFSPDEAYELAHNCGATPREGHREIDRVTLASAGNDFIRDDAFFRMLGVNNLQSIDVNVYEGATIIHDLNKTLPPELMGTADVIVDGSTLDNVFDPVTTICNLVKMLRVGGRLLSYNVGSNHNCPYVILTPLWLYDYFVVNRFVDVRVYVVIYGPNGLNVLTVEPQIERPKAPAWTPNIETGHKLGLVVLAEKGPESVSWEIPIQHQYRSSEDYVQYLQNAQVTTDRPDLMHSTTDLFVHVPPGYRFIP